MCKSSRLMDMAWIEPFGPRGFSYAYDIEQDGATLTKEAFWAAKGISTRLPTATRP